MQFWLQSKVPLQQQQQVFKCLLFQWNLSYLCDLLKLRAFVHTNTFWFDSAYFLIRLGLPSTLTRWSFSSANPYTLENTLGSGPKRKRILIVFAWWRSNPYQSENGDVTIPRWVFFELAHIVKMTSRHVYQHFRAFQCGRLNTLWKR